MVKRRNCSLLKAFVVFGFIWFAVLFFVYPQPQSSPIPEGIIQEPEVQSHKIYDVKSKMYSEMGFVPIEKRIYDLDETALKLHRVEEVTKLMKIKDDPETSSTTENIFEDKNLGNLGKAVVMPSNLSAEVKRIYDEGWSLHCFNQYLSDLISLKRTLPDFRSDYCRKTLSSYSKPLPATSVIIIFHNEAWSTLLRSVHSVVDRSPEKLITEVILVDDFSDMDHLKKPLEDYMAKIPKVKILRADKREGLIRARIRGALVAKGPVLTFLDSHVECTEGWLEPLLLRIAMNSTNVVCPVIDTISDETFEYFYQKDPKNNQIGSFSWKLIFNWVGVSERENERRGNPEEPAHSPTMAGGLFSIDKAFFVKLGMYDPGFDIWGGENLELSFKTWMCGGTLEVVPCSHVGHIFRKKSPYKWRPGVNVLKINAMRLAEVWLDDYAKFYYQRTGHVAADFGDISDRLKLKKELGCKSFKWYLENVCPEMFDPTKAKAIGHVKSIFNNQSCVFMSSDNIEKSLSVARCSEHRDDQYFWLTESGEIKNENFCLDFPGKGKNVIGFGCHKQKGSQLWGFLPETNQIFHNSTHFCLTLGLDNKVIIDNCNSNNARQKWFFNGF